MKAPSHIKREPRPWWVTRLLQLSACLGLKSMISRAVGVSSLLGVSQGHGGSRGSSKVAMSSPENSAEGAKGYRASFQSNGRPRKGRPGGARHSLEAIHTWLEIRQISASEEAIWFYLEERKNLKQKSQFVTRYP